MPYRKGSTEHWQDHRPDGNTDTTDSITIRQADARDFPAISRLITTPEELFLVFPAGSWPFTVRQVHRLSEQRSDLTVVTDNDDVTGFANLYDLEPRHRACIGNVIVKSSYRGRGIGKRLLRHMLHIVFNRYGLPEARISVFSDNVPARRLYASLGFHTYAEEKRIHPEGHQVFLLHMRLDRSCCGCLSGLA